MCVCVCVCTYILKFFMFILYIEPQLLSYKVFHNSLIFMSTYNVYIYSNTWTHTYRSTYMFIDTLIHSHICISIPVCAY